MCWGERDGAPHCAARRDQRELGAHVAVMARPAGARRIGSRQVGEQRLEVAVRARRQGGVAAVL
jgi:hypothetical protein